MSAKTKTPMEDNLKSVLKKGRKKRRGKDLTSREGHIQKLVEIVEDKETERRNQLDAMRQLAKITGLSDRKLDLSSLSIEERTELIMDTVAPVLAVMGFEIDEKN